jgi:hypothetical protein
MTQKRYRLLARAQLDGEVRQPGYLFTLAEGARGPHRTIVASNAGGMAWRHFSEPELLPPEARRWHEDKDDPMRDEPLFEEIKEYR